MSIPAAQPDVPRAGAAQPVTYPPIVLAPVALPKGMSVASFVLGLCSVVFGVVFVVPLLSVIFGIAGLRKEPAGRGFAIAGLVMSGLIFAVWVVVALLFLTIIVGGALNGLDAAATEV